MQSTGYSFTTPSSTCISEDLLFFDTFSHSNSEKDNFDLVQFPSPVVIDLIRIVPLGQPIEAKIPGNVRLGATNPSNCELEFFINDLSKQDAHTMTDLGKFYCSERDTDFNPPLQIQTDGLLLRGSYRTLTLAIFGQIAYDEKVEDDQILLSATSPPAQTPASPVASERDVPYIVRSVDHDLIRRAREEPEIYEESTSKSVEMQKESPIDNVDMVDDAILELVEPIPTKDRVIIDDYSENDGARSECYSSRDKKNDDVDFSNGTDMDNTALRSNTDQSIKNLADFADISETASNQDGSNEDSEEWSFNPTSYTPEELVYFPDPSLTLQERSLILHESKSVDPNYREATKKEIEKVREMFEVSKSPNTCKSDWVTLIEDLTNDLANMSLSQTVSDTGMLKFLIQQVLDGLSFESALNQSQTGFKVRHLRAGLKLATILFQCGSLASKTLIEASVLQKVLHLFSRDQMTLPLRLLILKCLSAACDNVECIEHMISEKHSWDGTCLSIGKIKKSFDKNSSRKVGMDREDRSLVSKFDSVNNNETEDVPNVSTVETKEQFIEDTKSRNNAESEQASYTCYQYLILILLSKPTTRLTIAIGNLLQKIRLYLNYAKLNNQRTDNDVNESDSILENSENSTFKDNVDLEKSVILLQDIVQLMKDGCACIAQPIRQLPARIQFQVKPNPSDVYLPIYRWLKHFKTLDQLNNSLITIRSSTNKSTSSADVELSIKFQNLYLTFIQQIIDSPRGTQFLLSDPIIETTTKILKTLADMHPPRRSSHVRLSDGIENSLSASLCRDELLAALSCRDASLRMAHTLKVFSCIDQLFLFHRELISKRVDTQSEPEKILHQLFIISNHPYGIAAIVKHLSCIGNLDCLLRFLDVPDHNKHLEFVKETSIDYALELVGTFFRLNNNVLEIAEEYLDTLVDLCKIETREKNLTVRIKSLLPWLNPFEVDQPFPLITYTEETFRLLTRVIRKSIPDQSIPFAKALDFELPPQMITAVRILRQLCIQPQVERFLTSNFDMFSTQKFITNAMKSGSFMTFVDSLPHQQNFNQSWNLNLQLSRQNGTNVPSDDSLTDDISQISNTFKLFQPYEESICGELKYHYGIMQVFEQEGSRRLLNTLRELTGNYPRPIYQSAALTGMRGRIVLSYINGVIVLLHSITCHLIDARGSEFKDTSIIPVILETYSLLCFVPKPDSELMLGSDVDSLNNSITIKSDNYNLAQQTKKLILSILMSYTQMCLSVSESEEKVISKSMWTKMLKEVIEFTLSTPVFFHHGLDVLTQILPSPLPGSSMMDSIDQEQLFKNINHRKLWSAHLHPLHQQIEQMISGLSICYQNNIRTLLYYLCNQLCDLSSNAACMVAKITTDTLLSYAAKLNGNPTTNEATPEQLQQQSSIISHQQIQNEDRAISNVLSGTKESAYASRMVLNLLSNLITNQSFETAFSNHLQVIVKRDEKIMANFLNTLKLHPEYKPNETLDDSNNSGATTNLNSVANLIESIKSLNDSSSKDGFVNCSTITSPPEELTKINLLNVAHKTSDRFPLTNSLSKTYRLKVLLDLNSRAHRFNETVTKRFDPQFNNYPHPSSSSHKSYPQPPAASRPRARTSSRPDAFRSRPQNTSRPPSIHVDDFVGLYGNSSAQPSSSSRYSTSGKPSGGEYRSSGSGRGYSDSQGAPAPPPGTMMHGDAGSHRHGYFNSQAAMLPSGSPYSSGSGRSHRKAKYL